MARVRRSLLSPGLTLMLCAIATLATAPETYAQAHPLRIVVLDLEIMGDLGGPELASAHQQRLHLATARLREGLARTNRYQVIETAAAQEDLDKLAAQYRYLHDCNGCEVDIARRLEADQTLVAWVHRVSALILTLNYEIHDVVTGRTVAKKSFSFRGDNDAAWTRAIDYMLKDLLSEEAISPADPR